MFSIPMPKLEMPKAAVRTELPAEIRFLVASSSAEPPAGSDWLHEIKHDGHRLLAATDGRGSLILRSRNGFDRTDLFQTPFDKLAKVGNQLVLDGERCAPDDDGVTHIDGLNGAISRYGNRDRLAYYAFDVLFLDGHDLRRCPLQERKELLRRVLSSAASERIVYVDYLIGQGAELFLAVQRIGAEGIVSKRISSIYRGGDSRDWAKTKCCETGLFHITGFKELGEGRLEELRVSEVHNGKLRPAGHVQFGFAGKGLWEMLDARRAGVARKGVVPVQPHLAADIRFYGRIRGWAIRDGVFLALREDAP